MKKKFLQKIKNKFDLFFKRAIISKSLISEEAIDVIEKLKEKKFEAYIVGGAIRDILLHLPPKDFDIATNATPDQVKSIFKRSRIIGRRFRLVHVIYGRNIIEVSTFRTNPVHKIHMKNGVLKDNEFGTMEEDAVRRDFTINAIYYDPVTNKIIDFYNGINDIKEAQLRLIGNPKQRYIEDPIRILRALRFSAKLKMNICDETKKQIKPSIVLLNKIPHSRLFDEVMKFFLTGHATESIKVFKSYDLSELYLPTINNPKDSSQIFIFNALQKTDERILNNKSVNPGFLLAAFLWPEVLSLWEKNKHKYPNTYISLNEAINKTLYTQNKKFPIQKRLCSTMIDIWQLQPRFNNLSSKKIYRLLGHPRFRAAYDFMLLRAMNEKRISDLSLWWTNFISADDTSKKILISQKVKSNHA